MPWLSYIYIIRKNSKYVAILGLELCSFIMFLSLFLFSFVFFLKKGMLTKAENFQQTALTQKSHAMKKKKLTIRLELFYGQLTVLFNCYLD